MPLGKMIKRILNDNSDKAFVKRILDGNRKSIKNPDGTISTHSMSYGEVDGRYIVYPTVEDYGGGLKRLPDREAMDKALKNKNYIEFGSAESADIFSKRYKEALK